MARLSNDEYYISLLPHVAARSTCLRRAVGAIIVDENNRVLAQGFNGVPSGFPHCGEIRREILDANDFINQDKYILGRRMESPVDCHGKDDPKGDTRRCMAVHAEINALLTCSDLRHAHTMYVSATPCKPCALAIANTNIKRIVCREVYADDARYILEAAEIKVKVIKSEDCCDAPNRTMNGGCSNCGDPAY